MKKYTLILFIFFMNTFTATAFADCTASIANHSTKPWKFRFESADQPEMTGAICSYDETCTIEPGHTATVNYMKQTFGNIYITDYKRQQKYYYYVYSGKISDTSCPKINHFTEKHTGSVSLNEPDFGSFSIDKDAW